MMPTTAHLAAASGLSAADVAFWLPRLPADLDDAAIAGKLRQIAALRESEPGTFNALCPVTPRPSRKGVPWSAERRARFEATRRCRGPGLSGR